MNPTQAGLFGSGRPTPKAARSAYLGRMPNNTFEFCIPSKATAVPIGPDWLHELKCAGPLKGGWITLGFSEIKLANAP